MGPIVTSYDAVRSRRALLIASTCLSCGLAAPAMAQSSVPPMPGPPVYSSVDENNVDLTTGIYRPSVELAAIGPKEDELKFVYSPDTYTSNLSGSIYVTTGVIGTTTYKFYKVSTDSTSAIFIQPPNAAIFSYINSQGQSLVYDATTQIYTYTNRQGIIYKFSKSPSSPLGNGDILSKKDLDGRTLTYMYAPCPGSSTCQRLIQVVSNKGYAIRYDYDSTSRISKVTAYNMSVDYCDPNAVTCAFSRAWPSSTVTQYPDYKSIAFTDEMNRTLSEIWNGTSATITSPTGKQAVITTDSSSRVTSVSRGGGTWSYSYDQDSSSSRAYVKDPFNQTTTYWTQLSVGRINFISDPVGSSAVGYNTSNGDLTGYGFRGAPVVSYTRDTRSNITQMTLAAKSGSGLPSIVTTSGFDTTCATPACNKPNWTKDAKGNQTDYTYDPVHGGVLTVTLPAATAGGVRPQRRYTYSQLATYAKTSSGTLAQLGSFWVVTGISECATGASCAGTADETKTTISYAGSNNLQPTSVTVAAGDGSVSSTTTTTYDPNGDIVSVDGPLPGSDDTVTYRYDLARELVGTISPDPDGTGGPLKRSAVKISYNADGQPVLKEAGIVDGTTDADWAAFSSQQQATTNYDSNGRRASDVITAGGTTYSVSQYSYDIAGRLDCTAVRMNTSQWASLPPSACTPQATGSAGTDRITKLSYDAVNRVTKVTGAYGTSDESDERTVTYTLSDKAQTETDARGNITTYTYDGFDRLVARAFPSKTVTGSSAACTIGTIAETTDGFGNTVTSPSETRTAGDDCEKYAYDRNGNRAALMKRDGNVIRYAYDALNRNTVKDIPGGTAADVYYGYDLRGLLTFARFVSASGLGIRNTYDGLARLSSATNDMDFAPLTLGYRYDAGGNRTRITHPDGTYFTYDYDALGRATTIKSNGASTIATITYDSQGRRQGDTRGAVNTTYGYDPVSRLTNLTNDLGGTTNDVMSTVDYNPAGQIVKKTRSNDVYAFTGYTNVSRPYTVNGLNQYTAAGSATFTYDDNGNLTGDGTNTYTYDVENRMVSATVAGATNTITYDPLGRLWQVSRGDGTSWFDYLHDGDYIVAKYGVTATANALNSRFVFGPGEDEPLIWYLKSDLSSPESFQSDAQGSIVSIADVSGNVSNIIAYDEYGIASYTAASRPMFGYTGQAWLNQIGLNYYKARMYSPTLGRFMQTDPIGYGDGMNSYNYVGEDPINGTDPTGLETYIQDGSQPEIPVTGHRNCVDRGDCLSNYDDLFRMYGPGRTVNLNGDGDGPNVQNPGSTPAFNRCTGSATVYPIPKGYRSAGDPTNRMVQDKNGVTHKNPNYENVIKNFKPNKKGIIGNFVTIILGSVGGGAAGGAAGGEAGASLGEIFVAATGAGAAGAAANDEMNGKDDQCGAKSIF